MGFLLRFVVTFIAVFVADLILPDAWFRMESLAGGAVFAAILALLNAFVRPIILLLTCPIQVLTLGLATLIINAIIFLAAASATQLFATAGVFVGGFFAAFVAALVVSLVGWIVSVIIPG